MATRWSDDPAFCEVATPYACLELVRDRLQPHGFEVSFFRQPDDKGRAAIKITHEKNRDNAVFRIHCPESRERLERQAKNIAASSGRRFGPQEA
jgi:hypothetical protein